jgi:hypothetical protein
MLVVELIFTLLLRLVLTVTVLSVMVMTTHNLHHILFLLICVFLRDVLWPLMANKALFLLLLLVSCE